MLESFSPFSELRPSSPRDLLRMSMKLLTSSPVWISAAICPLGLPVRQLNINIRVCCLRETAYSCEKFETPETIQSYYLQLNCSFIFSFSIFLFHCWRLCQLLRYQDGSHQNNQNLPIKLELSSYEVNGRDSYLALIASPQEFHRVLFLGLFTPLSIPHLLVPRVL